MTKICKQPIGRMLQTLVVTGKALRQNFPWGVGDTIYFYFEHKLFVLIKYYKTEKFWLLALMIAINVSVSVFTAVYFFAAMYFTAVYFFTAIYFTAVYFFSHAFYSCVFLHSHIFHSSVFFLPIDHLEIFIIWKKIYCNNII